MKLLVGLGNIGQTYTNTRHNIGFLCIDAFSKTHGFTPWKHEKKFFGSVSFGQIHQEKVLLLKPETFMNLSGKSVGALFQFYKLTPQDVLLIHDDVDLDFGKTRFRRTGTSGGHNGLKSLFSVLGTQEIARLKLGIKNSAKSCMDTADFVLGHFSPEEKEQMPFFLQQAQQDILTSFFHD